LLNKTITVGFKQNSGVQECKERELQYGHQGQASEVIWDVFNASTNVAGPLKLSQALALLYIRPFPTTPASAELKIVGHFLERR